MPIGMTPCFRRATWRRGIVPFWNIMGANMLPKRNKLCIFAENVQ